MVSLKKKEPYKKEVRYYATFLEDGIYYSGVEGFFTIEEARIRSTIPDRILKVTTTTELI